MITRPTSSTAVGSLIPASLRGSARQRLAHRSGSSLALDGLDKNETVSLEAARAFEHRVGALVGFDGKNGAFTNYCSLADVEFEMPLAILIPCSMNSFDTDLTEVIRPSLAS